MKEAQRLTTQHSKILQPRPASHPLVGINGPSFFWLHAVNLDALLRALLDSSSAYWTLAIPSSATEVAYNASITVGTPVVKKPQCAVS